jgi:hypothetical protein
LNSLVDRGRDRDAIKCKKWDLHKLSSLTNERMRERINIPDISNKLFD